LLAPKVLKTDRIGSFNNQNQKNHNDINNHNNQHDDDNQSDIGIENTDPVRNLRIFFSGFFSIIFITDQFSISGKSLSISFTFLKKISSPPISSGFIS
jgi:hypothetical protein